MLMHPTRVADSESKHVYLMSFAPECRSRKFAFLPTASRPVLCKTFYLVFLRMRGYVTHDLVQSAGTLYTHSLYYIQLAEFPSDVWTKRQPPMIKRLKIASHCVPQGAENALPHRVVAWLLFLDFKTIITLKTC